MVGINPTKFEITLSSSFFGVKDILTTIHDEEVIVLDSKVDRTQAMNTCTVQTMENLRVEILHFNFLRKYNLLT